tara:strand:+ start:8898 stop:9302 length:405 start_codon:yes stop_codon:yes gene_type:complete
MSSKTPTKESTSPNSTFLYCESVTSDLDYIILEVIEQTALMDDSNYWGDSPPPVQFRLLGHEVNGDLSFYSVLYEFDAPDQQPELHILNSNNETECRFELGRVVTFGLLPLITQSEFRHVPPVELSMRRAQGRA